jgi:XTP/dITP diphosphohydrolase
VDELQSIDVVDVVEHKARAAYAVAWEPVIVEDTGLYFEAWNGLPGALIKRFLKTVDRKWILQMMKTFENREAKAMCCIGYFDGKDCTIATWTIKWRIATEIMWESNFWWDPIFIPAGQAGKPEGYDKSFAQMSMEEKNAISHRGNAFREFKKVIANGWLPIHI